MLPNNIFDMPLDVYAFKIYAYLVCCAGNRGECWPSLQKMSSKLGIAMSTVQDRINLLEKRKLIAIRKHSGSGKYKNNVYAQCRFLDKKRSEGKPYYVYMTAGMTKFLRIYYGKVRDCLKEQGLWEQPFDDGDKTD